MKNLFFIFVLAFGVNASSGDQEVSGRSGWVCNAYGRTTGARGVWQTVTGGRFLSRSAAASSAMATCNSRMIACSLSGCWNE